jgi:signal transduction protein with GAF and PtsI domain
MSLTDELLEMHLQVRPTSNTAAVLRLLIRTGMQLIDAQEGSLLVVDKEADCLRFAMTVGNDEQEIKLIGESLAFGVGWTGQAASTREVQVGAPKYRDFRQAERVDGEGPEAVIAAPMVVDDRLVGVITAVTFEKGRRFDSHAARRFGAFAIIGAVLVDQEQRLAQQENHEGILGVLSNPAAQQIRDVVVRLALKHPSSLPNIANMLSNMERALTGGS